MRRLIRIVVETAKRISSVVRSRDRTRRDRPRAVDGRELPRNSGTDPKQYLTDYVEFTDRVLPPIQDPIQKSDPRIVFCVAWARGGYLPTHNPNYRLPQGKDPVWNNANCRNRRLFNDRAVKKVAANTRPFLLQTYRRDMGGGNFVLMKDALLADLHSRPPLGRLPDGLPAVLRARLHLPATRRVRVVVNVVPLKDRGRRECRALVAPAALCAKMKSTQA